MSILQRAYQNDCQHILCCIQRQKYIQSVFFIIKRKWWQLVWEKVMSEEKTCLTSLWRDEDDLWEATEHRISFPSKREINTFHSNTCLKSHSGDKLTSALTHLPACYSDALFGNVTLLIILLQCMWWPSQLCIWGWHMEKEQINTLCFGFREKQNINQLKMKTHPSSLTHSHVIFSKYIYLDILFQHFI